MRAKLFQLQIPDEVKFVNISMKDATKGLNLSYNNNNKYKKQ